MRFGEFLVRLGYMFCEVWVRFGVQNMYGLDGISLNIWRLWDREGTFVRSPNLNQSRPRQSGVSWDLSGSQLIPRDEVVTSSLFRIEGK